MAAKDKSSTDGEQVPPAQPPAQQPQPMQIVPAPAVPPQPTVRLDEVPWEGGGGRFLVNGQLVNHDGKPLNKDGSLKKDET